MKRKIASLVINAVIGEVKSARSSVSGYATNQDFGHNRDVNSVRCG